jgi:NAD(P)H-hydrate epimerase
VLTGLVLGLLAQRLDPFDAAFAAAWLRGAVATAFGSGLVAGDLVSDVRLVAPTPRRYEFRQDQQPYSLRRPT